MDCGTGHGVADPGKAPVAGACSECGSTLRPVRAKTVKHLLNYELARSLQPGRFLFCADRDCDIVYLRFSDSNDTGKPDDVFRWADVKERARPFARGRDRFVCYCFGYTVGEIEDDASSGRNAIPDAITDEIRVGNCACEVMNPAGH